MNRKGDEGADFIWDNFIYIIALVILIGGTFLLINHYQNGAAIWEDYYAKEIVRIIDLGCPGDEITLDVHKATEIAKKNRVNFDNIFILDNVKNEVCVKLSPGKITCYYFFNDVNVEEIGNGLHLDFSYEDKVRNVYLFRIKEAVHE